MSQSPSSRAASDALPSGSSPGPSAPSGDAAVPFGPDDDGQRTATPASAASPELLAAAARGDNEAWRKLVHLYGRRIFALVNSRLRRHDLSEEVTQSVFATVSVKLISGQYDESGRFEPWLFRIAVNRVRDAIRHERRRIEFAAGDWSADAADANGSSASESDFDGSSRVESAASGFFGGRMAEPGRSTTSGQPSAAPTHLVGLLHAALAELADADREVIELRHHAALTFAQMAEMLGEPLGTLLARHHRALKKLRVLLAAKGCGGLSDAAGAESDDQLDSPPASGVGNGVSGLAGAATAPRASTARPRQ